MRDKKVKNLLLATVLLCFFASSCSSKTNKRTERTSSADFRTCVMQNLGISIRIPSHWGEIWLDDDTYGVGEVNIEGSDAIIIISRESGFSPAKKYPNLPRLPICRQLLHADVMHDKMIKIGEITIAGNEWHFAVKEVAAPVPAHIMRVYFWNDFDSFSVAATTPRESFKAREPLFREILQSISFEQKPNVSGQKKLDHAHQLLFPNQIEPNKLANIYLEAWSKKDFAKMWAVCSPEPFFISETSFKTAMKGFQIPVRNGKILNTLQGQDDPNTVLVTYKIEGPTLGCILCIVRSFPPAAYSMWLQRVRSAIVWNGTLTICKEAKQWKITDDTNNLIRIIYSIYGMELLLIGDTPKTRLPLLVAVEAQRRNMGAEEFMDEYYPEMVSCFEELTGKKIR